MSEFQFRVTAVISGPLMAYNVDYDVCAIAMQMIAMVLCFCWVYLERNYR